MAQLRPKIVKLAKVIGGVSGMVVKIDENAPEYYCMANIVSDDEADIAIAAGLRKERTAEYLAKKVGKTVEEIKPLLDHLVYYGIFRRTLDEKARRGRLFHADLRARHTRDDGKQQGAYGRPSRGRQSL